MDKLREILRRQPWSTMLALVGVWIALAILNVALKREGVETGVPNSFPISEFAWRGLRPGGVLYIVAFAVVLTFAAMHCARWSAFRIWFFGLTLIVLGNLGQGNFDAGFLKPFYAETEAVDAPAKDLSDPDDSVAGIQYYHDALRIDDPAKWLRHFNENQPNLLCHSRTHPPFAVLVHYPFVQVDKPGFPFRAVAFQVSPQLTGPFLMAITFVLISSLVVPLFLWALHIMGIDRERSSLLAMLLAVLPAVNIYAAVCLDGVVASAAGLILVGFISVQDRGLTLGAALLFIAGFVICNLLTFLSIALAALTLFGAIRYFIVKRKPDLLYLVAMGYAVMLAVIVLLKFGFGYDHIESFFTTSRVHNPEGLMRIVREPVQYVMTRVESFSELALFFSFPCLAFLFHRRMLRLSPLDLRDRGAGLGILAVMVAVAMFLAGAFRTGETARVLMFFYPYILLAFRRLEPFRLRDLILLAGFQTAIMQLYGYYYW